MFGKKKVVAIEPPVANDRLTADVLEKHVKTIRRNELVSDDKELASKIVERSQLVKLPKDHVMITQGEDADEVYFLLFGSTNVLINSRQIDCKRAPKTVGEMAAMKPGTARSADVIVNAEGVVARVMSAHDFRNLMSCNQDFHFRLVNMVDDMGRKNINLLGEGLKTARSNWTWTALCIGAAFGAFSGLGAWLFGAPILLAILLALGGGGIVTLVAIRLNPDYIYRNMFWLCGLSLIAHTVNLGFSTSFSVNGTEERVPFFWDFSSNSDQTWGIIVLIYAALIGLAWISWMGDQGLRRKPDRHE